MYYYPSGSYTVFSVYSLFGGGQQRGQTDVSYDTPCTLYQYLVAYLLVQQYRVIVYYTSYYSRHVEQEIEENRGVVAYLAAAMASSS